MNIPRIVITGTNGGSGKTLLSLGLIRAFTRRGLSVAPFKKGPDYIDAAWLSLAAGRACTNLDPYFMDRQGIRALFLENSRNADIAVVEGNRGLYDGLDDEGSCSTAELSRDLEAPVILSLNCTKMTRTAAAVVAGMVSFESVNFAGVVLSQIRGPRHDDVIRKSMNRAGLPPVLGSLKRLRPNPIPERHMGLSEADENTGLLLDRLADFIEESVDVEKILSIAKRAGMFADSSASASFPDEIAAVEGTGHSASPKQDSPTAASAASGAGCTDSPRIGYVHDEALWFIYPDNLKALEKAGARLVRLSLFDTDSWPGLDGLYLPGGFPELHAEALSRSPRVKDLAHLSESGLPIYAECGGFMVLCRSVRIDGREIPLAGVFTSTAEFQRTPQGLGYVNATVTRENPFLPLGTRIRGHEFHYSKCSAVEAAPTCLTLSKGLGMGRTYAGAADGFLVRNTFAAYTHIFAPAVPEWAESFVRAAIAHRS